MAAALCRLALRPAARGRASSVWRRAASGADAAWRPAFDEAAPVAVGWVGTGVMGASMAGHLQRAGHDLHVFNRTMAKAQALLDAGARACPSPAAVAAAAPVVFTMVGFPADVRRVMLDPDTGVVPNLAPGAVVVDMTTTEPSLSAEIAEAAAARGARALDAPVSGGDAGARNATLSIMVGGDEAAFRAVEPLLDRLGTSRLMGPAGSGQQTKMGNQIAIATTMVGLCESMLYAHRAGLDVEAFLSAIAGGAAGSRSLDLYAARILKGDMDPGFMSEHFVKDLGISLRECERMGISLPGLSLAHALYVGVCAQGHGRSGTQALVRALESLNGVELPTKR